jgi:hypothetical protein
MFLSVPSSLFPGIQRAVINIHHLFSGTPPTFYDSISSFLVPRCLFPGRQCASVPDLFSGVPPTFYDSINSFPVPRRLVPRRQLAAVPDLFSGVSVVVQLRLAGVDGLHEAGALASKDKKRSKMGG